MSATPGTLNLYFPLWCAKFDSDEVGILAPGVACYVPNADEWRTVQKTDVWMAQWRSGTPSAQGPPPPCCIVVVIDLDRFDSIHAAINAMGPLMLASARDAVTALRLFRAGWFLDPEQAMYTFYAPSLPINLLRSPGPYRQTLISGTDAANREAYKLAISDLSQDLAAPGPITRTWQLLADYRQAGQSDSVDIAIESFNRSYGYQLHASSRASNLFTALDAMLGGMSARRVGKVKINFRGFARRVETALRFVESGSVLADAHLEALWLNAQGRQLRNSLAHSNGQSTEANAAAAFDRLQEVVRCVLRQYLHFAVHWLTNREEIAQQLKISSDSQITAAYVKILEVIQRSAGELLYLVQPANGQKYS